MEYFELSHLTKDKFIAFLKGKINKCVDIPYFPMLVLNITIEEANDFKINETPLIEYLDEYHFYSYIYNRWKENFHLLLAYFSDSSPEYNIINGANSNDGHEVHRNFESLFLEIDGLNIFEMT